MNRIETVLDMESSITEHPAAETGSLTLDGAGREGKETIPAENAVVFSKVGLTYAGASEEALSDIDFTVRRRDHRYYRRNRFWKIFGRESDSMVLRCDQRRGSRRREECAGLYIG